MQIEIYSIGKAKTEIKPTYRSFRFSPKLENFARDNWLKKHQGWMNSFIPNMDYVESENGKLRIHASVTNYADQYGVILSILEGKDFAPRKVNGLAIGINLLTSDRKIILPRRSETVKHAPLVYSTCACGWMSTMNIDKAKCEDLRFTSDSRLYDIEWQAKTELEEESKLPKTDFALTPNPTSIVIGRKVSFNPVIGLIAGTKRDSGYVRNVMARNKEEFAPGRHEHDRIGAVSIHDLEQLLRNQPQLQEEDPTTFNPSCSKGTDLILVDESMGRLIHDFELLTDRPRPKDLIDHLGCGGIEIIEMQDPEQPIAA
jgi:hypothetical protein